MIPECRDFQNYNRNKENLHEDETSNGIYST